MTRKIPRSRRLLVASAAVAALAASELLAGSTAIAGPNHTTIVSDVPSAATPDIQDNSVASIYDAGSKVIAGGNFTRVQNRDSDVDITRNSVLAFDKATGVVDEAFAPTVDGDVRSVIAGPTPGTVYIAGSFNTVNGVTRRKVALLNVSDGSLVTAFKPPAFNGLVQDVILTGGQLLVGGVFTNAGAVNPRNGLASLNPATGAINTYLTHTLTGHHNYNGTGANAPVGVEHMAASPDGTKLAVIGNFKNVNGVLQDQAVLINLNAADTTVADWNTTRYQPRCASNAFDSYVRDVAFAPDSSYFVIVTTGAYNVGTLCDTAARWETNATGQTQQPTWINYTGGDTLLSVAVSEQAIYVGGHIRWLNNSLARDRAGAGAVPVAADSHRAAESHSVPA